MQIFFIVWYERASRDKSNEPFPRFYDDFSTENLTLKMGYFILR